MPREQPPLKGLVRPVTWARITMALERAKGESWAQFSIRHGDWGRDAALWLGRRQGRLSLAHLGGLVGGLDYGAVGQAVGRFERRLDNDVGLRQQMQRVQLELLNVET